MGPMASTYTPTPPPFVPPLSIRFANRRAAVSASRIAGGELALIVPCTDTPEVGIRVRISVQFGDCDGRFEIAGFVEQVRPAVVAAKCEAGLLIRFEGEDKRAAAGMLAVCAGKPE